jgi:hypothetical protein
VARAHPIRTGAPVPAAHPRRRLERRFLRLILDAGLPAPLVNHRISAVEADFAWPEYRVIVELDGYEFHRARFEADRAKDQRLAAQGHVVVRITWLQLRDEPLKTIALLAQTLAMRSPRRHAPAAACRARRRRPS